jgi:hypothetical protein
VTLRSRPRRIIWLLDDEVQNEQEGFALIAHEIAHVWLGHRVFRRGEAPAEAMERAHQEERAASQLAKDWGFSGSSADPDAYPGSFCLPERDHYADTIFYDWLESMRSSRDDELDDDDMWPELDDQDEDEESADL